jgi:hypothetical protein
MKPKPKGATPRKTFRLSENDLEMLEYIRANCDWSSGPVKIPATTANAMRFAINVAHEMIASNVAGDRKRGEK